MSNGKWSLRNIYLYLVCLITLIMVIVGTVGVIRSGVEMLYPDPGYYSEKPLDVKGNPVSDAEWQRQLDLQKAQTTRQAVLNLVGNVALVVIAGPLYVYHWRKIETEKSEPVVVTAPTAGA